MSRINENMMRLLMDRYGVAPRKKYGQNFLKDEAILDAIVEGYTHWNSNIHRGVHYLSQLATSKHEEARKAVAS